MKYSSAHGLLLSLSPPRQGLILSFLLGLLGLDSLFCMGLGCPLLREAYFLLSDRTSVSLASAWSASFSLSYESILLFHLEWPVRLNSMIACRSARPTLTGLCHWPGVCVSRVNSDPLNRRVFPSLYGSSALRQSTIVSPIHIQWVPKSSKNETFVQLFKYCWWFFRRLSSHLIW